MANSNWKLKSCVQFFPIENNLFHVYDSSTSRHFKLGDQEVAWLKLLDGKTPTETLSETIPFEYIEDFLKAAQRFNLLEGDTPKQKSSLLKIKLLKFNPSKLFNSMGRFSEFYSRFLDIFTVPIFLINLFILAVILPRAMNMELDPFLNFGTIIFYFCAILLSGTIHEGSHALVARANKIAVPAMGVMLYFLHPTFYVDVSGINLIPDKRKRIKVLAAGVQGNNLLLLVTLLLCFVPLGETVFQYLLLMAGLNFALMFINLIPFVEYDGYFIFQELVDEKGFSRKASAHALTSKSKKLDYLFYFLVSNVFQIMLVISALLLIHRGIGTLWQSKILDIGVAVLVVIALAVPVYRMKTLR